MHVTITCKYEKDRIKKTAEKKWQHRFFSIITLSVAMETSSRIWPNFKLIQALMYESSFPASMKCIQSRTAEKKWQHRFSHYKSMDFFRPSRAANSAVRGRIWLNFELLRALMHVIVTLKYKKDRIKKS